MNPSFRLGKIAGIKVGLHWSVGLIAALITFTLAGSLLPNAAPGFTGLAYVLVAAATAALFLASIVAHELGHSLVARRNNLGIEGITLFALGGVAVMTAEPTRAGPAFRIAVAGPLVSLGVGALSIGAAWLAGLVGLAEVSVAALLWLGVINIGLALFNMLPAYPLDGGRVLQAALWSRSGDSLKATASASSVGRILGSLVMFASVVQYFMTGSGIWTAAIGWFIAGSAKSEQTHARRSLVEREKAAQAARVTALEEPV
ncbi:MAG: Zn-dependent protease [Candidatus Poriferisodalaceae bacterium]|jgi:Zn-dependent protease